MNEGLAEIKEYLRGVQDEFLRLHDTEREPHRVVLYRSAAMDRLLIRLCEEARAAFLWQFHESPQRFSLVAQGGYGRRELCLYSDLDLLFLHEGKADRFVSFLTERVLQSLWDAGLEVGFATRTVRDCRLLMDKDLTILSSLVDARYLTGDPQVFESFQAMMHRYWESERHRENYYQMKLRESGERNERYGGSVYLLEPNVKEGEGGLRDFHTFYWLSRISGGISSFESLSEDTSLWRAVSFFWSVRNQLHRLAGRRQDQLLFEYQRKVAEWFGKKDSEHILGVESFMQDYYRYAATIRRISEKGCQRLREKEGRLFSVPRGIPSDYFETHPFGLLQLFEEARRQTVQIDEFAKELIEKNLYRIDESFRRHEESTKLFRGMLRNPIGLGPILAQMNETGVLGTYLPEFAKLHFRVQHDIYHVYTVDVHSIFAVSELGKLLQGNYDKEHPSFAEAARDIEKKDVLAFGILYHDIGKGEGKGHVEKGAPLIRQAAIRLGFPAEDQEALEFLERSHLIMTHLAFRRDLEDPNLIIQFARSIPTLELLNMLFVLTFCDVRGVGPEAMTDWKASLLEYLYLKTREVILKGAFAPERISSQIPRIREELAARLTLAEDRQLLERFSRVMPPRYFQATSHPLILHHLRLWRRLAHERIVFECRAHDKEGVNEITLLTVDSPALFSKMTGICAAHHINILGAELTVSREGQALHVFRVVDPQGEVIHDEDKWLRVQNDIEAVLSGKLRIEELVADKFRPSVFRKKTATVLPTRIDIDNDVSAYYTVIDVYAQDRIGLLYQITSTLAALGLYVEVSKISTKVDQVADTFYVKDIFGHKITEGARLTRIRELLTTVVETIPDPGWRPPKTI